MDWKAWHKLYESSTPLQRRLELVRSQIAAALDAAPPGEIRLISVCAGDGRDVLGALSGHPRVRDVRARLVELNPELVASGRAAIEQANLAGQVEFVQGDATLSSLYKGIAPAQVVVMAGMIGLVDAAEIPGLVRCLGCLTTRDGRVVWTRNLDFRDGVRHSMALRQALTNSSFKAVTFKMTSWSNFFRRSPQARFVVATHMHLADPEPLPAGHNFFRITDDDCRLSA